MRGRHGADAALGQLLAMKSDIEREVGEPLTWNPYPEKQDKSIVLHRSANLSERPSWASHLEWMATTIDKMRKAFGPRIRALDLTEDGDEEEPEA
jgi:hypothetical protein